MSRGANLTEKIPHAIFQTIRGFSHTDQIKAGHYYYIGYHIPQLGTLDYRNSELREVLEELIKEKLITQLFLIKFDPTAHTLKLIPCYVARPEDNRQTTEQLYRELLMQSVESIEEFIKTAPGLDREKMVKELEVDLSSSGVPDPARLPSTLFSPLDCLDPGNFDFVPPAELIQRSREIISEELFRRKAIAALVEYGWMPLRPEEIVRRFEIAQEFLSNRVLPHYRTEKGLMEEIRAIRTNEESYYLDTFAPRTADFGFKKASALKKHLMTGVDRKNRIPGSLAVEIVLALQRDVEKAYKDIQKLNADREYRELRNGIVGPDVSAIDRLRFFDEEEVAEITPEVWSRLTSSVDLLHATYEKNQGTCNLLTQNDTSLFPPLVLSLLNLNPEEHWKILAFKTLVDRHESSLHSLFYDAEFMNIYGQLLRKAYWNRIPWYYRFLLLLGLKMFTDSAFQGAKKRISQQQTDLHRRNQTRRDAAERQRIIQKKEKAAQAETLHFLRQIIETVDRWIYEDGLPPLIAEVAAEIPEGNRLSSFVESQGFKTIPYGDSALLLYPVDFNWRSRAARLRRHLQKQLEAGMSPGEARQRSELVLEAVNHSFHKGSAMANSKAPGQARQVTAVESIPHHDGDY